MIRVDHPTSQAHTVQLDTSGQGVGIGVRTWTPFSALQMYAVQLSTGLFTQVSLG